ncbi:MULTISPECIES: McrB family protein [unclassified Gilliamella]|uniref:McrB family protein n=1 Tax=unclassified Gilliamella TaxID=2685620 RepID=UPI00226A26D2|nr:MULTISPECIES: AAA family ATPase [unclassified Gilliamella]MCX8588432.1 AAA family ATPase [Gilliamella sp. B3801]MCX8591292.1 AAA family ATPase [Gilliamella sp. B3804]
MEAIKTYWFLSAKFNGSEDQTERFVKLGIWENGYDNKYLNTVRGISVGDRVAIKSTYNLKNNLPFDNKGQAVSVMEIKATGIVTKNYGDGKLLEVKWQKKNLNKKWYFFTNIATIWSVKDDEWLSKQLINFTFYNKPQDIDYFRNAPYWRSRYGDNDTNFRTQLFKWIPFYEAVADNLLIYQNKEKRSELMVFINELAIEFNLSYLLNKNIHDICPFTALGTFNRNIKEITRKQIAKKWAEFLNLNESIPNSFEGIPLLNNQASWFFTNSENQQQEIDNLWEFYATALKFSNADENYQDEFEQKFDLVMSQPYCSWQLTNGLFWIRPHAYVVLDKVSKVYLTDELGLIKDKRLSKGHFNGNDYLKLLDNLAVRFNEDYFPIHSFPELYLTALRKYQSSISHNESLISNNQWQFKLLQLIKELCQKNGTDVFQRKEFLNKYREQLEEEFPNNSVIGESVSNTLQRLRDKDFLQFLGNGKYRLRSDNIDEQNEEIIESDDDIVEQLLVKQPYTLESLIQESCFVDEQQLQQMLASLKMRKNIILQGPPGTGKTWLAKRLANIVIGYKDSNNIRAIQFHPNLSYEDFIRGFRPASDGKLALIDGPFLEIIHQARNDPQSKYVMVIEEINRGNPAQIFGEMLTLLEADKRTPSEALELTYRREQENGIYIPDNLYVIGTMNIADRSLALVDFALRRRFAFFTLDPNFSEKWLSYMIKKTGLNSKLLEEIKERMNELNEFIAQDRMLGSAFAIGHSYLTHHRAIPKSEGLVWYQNIIDTEVKPLLEEYWFDEKDKLNKAMKLITIAYK